MTRTTARAWLAGAALSACSAFACGGEITAVGEPGPSPTAPPTGTGGPALPSPSAEIPPAPAKEGSVYVHTLEYVPQPGKSDFLVTADAWFGVRRESSGIGLSGCEVVDVSPPGTGSASSTSDSAGTISVDVTLGPEKKDVRLAFDAAKKEYESYSDGADGAANGTIHVGARGGAVPAFSADLPALAPVKLLLPDVATMKIGARDLPVSWTADPSAEFSVLVIEGGAKIVRCAPAKGTGNEVTVPAALMTVVLEGLGADFVRLTLFTGRSIRVDAGDYRVSIQHTSTTFVDFAKE